MTRANLGLADGDVEECDVVVVGARCAGAATAMLLARAGMRVVVVDRSNGPDTDTVSTHALMRGGVLQLRRWGLLDAIIASGTPPVRSATFHYQDSTFSVSMRPFAGVDALYAPRRTVLDATIVAAARQAGADVRFGVSVTGLLTDEQGRVTGVAGVDRAGRRQQIRAALTVGADGIGSTLAHAVAAPVERIGPTGGSVLYGYWANLPTDGYEWFYQPGASAGMIPTNDGLTCVFVGATPNRVRQARGGGARSGFEAVLAAAAPGATSRVAAAAPVGSLRGFTGRPSYLRRCSGPGWALVGDAGYFRDPLSTHGITDAFRDAELLARAVAAADGRIDRAETLAGYGGSRDRLATPLMAAADQLSTYTWDSQTLPPILRALSAAMNDELQTLQSLDQPPVRPRPTSAASQRSDLRITHRG